MSAVGTLEIELIANLAKLQGSMNRAEKTVDGAMRNIEKSVSFAKNALGGLVGAVGIQSIIKIADEYKRFDSQIKLATKSTQEYTQAYGNVVRIARISQSDIGAIGILYARLTNNLRDFGTTQKEIGNITESVALSLRVSNATVQETNSVMLQLSQSFGSGKINGQEFLAVSEGAPIIMRQLAKSLGKTYGELKNLSTQGKLTAEVLKTALNDPEYLAGLREQVKSVGTVSSAITVFKNNLTQFIGEADKGTSSTKLMSQGIIFLADNLNILANGALTFAVVKTAQFVQSIYLSMTAMVNQSLAAKANAAAIVQAEAQATAAKQAATTAQISMDRLKAFGKVRLLELSVAEAQANVVALAGTAKEVNAQKVLEAQTYKLVMAKGALAKAHGAVGVSMANNALATTLAARNAGQLANNIGKVSLASKATSLAMTGLNGAMALLGGGIGVAVLALAGLAYWLDRVLDKRKYDRFGEAIDEVIAKSKELKKQESLGVDSNNIYAKEIARIKSLEKARDGLFAKLKMQEKSSRDGGVFSASKEDMKVTASEYLTSIKLIKDAEKDLAFTVEQENERKKISQQAQIQATKEVIGASKAKTAAVEKETEAEKARRIAEEERVKFLQDSVNASYDTILSSVAITESIQQEIDKTNESIDIMRLGEEGYASLEIARLNEALATNQQIVAQGVLNGITEESLAFAEAYIQTLKEQIALKEELAGAKLSEKSFKAEKDAIKESEKLQKDSIKDIAKEQERASQDFSRSLTDAIFRGFESGKGFAKNFKETLINSFKTLVLQPIVRFLVDSSGISKVIAALSGGFSGGASAAGASGGGGIFSTIKDAFTSGNNSIVSTISSIGQSLSAFGSAGTGFFSDMASKFGSFMQLNTSTVASALPYLGAVVSLLKGDIKGAAFTAAGVAIGNAIFPVIGGVIGGAIGSFVGGLFGKKKIKRYGTAANGRFDGENFTETNRRKFYDRDLGAASALSGLSEVFSRNLSVLFKSFGVNSTIFTSASQHQRGKSKKAGGDFSSTIDGVTTGTSVVGKKLAPAAVFKMLTDAVLGEGLVKAIKASSLSDGVKKFFDNLTKKEDVADAINTLAGLNQALADLPPVFNAIRNAIDTTDYLTSIAQLKARYAAIGTYTNLFYSEQENFATFTKQLTTQFTLLGATLPSTRDGFRALVDSITVTNEATSDQFNGLVALAPAADAYYKALLAQQDALNATTASAQQLADELNQNLFSTFADYRSAQAALENGQSINPFVGDVLSKAASPTDSNAALIAEIKQLRADNANLQVVMEAVAKYTYDTAKTQKQWNNDGLPAERVI